MTQEQREADIMPGSEQERRENFRNAARKARAAGKVVIQVWRAGDEPTQASSEPPELATKREFDRFFAGLLKAADEESALAKGGGGSGVRPCERVAEVAAKLRCIMRDKSVQDGCFQAQRCATCEQGA